MERRGGSYRDIIGLSRKVRRVRARVGEHRRILQGCVGGGQVAGLGDAWVTDGYKACVSSGQA